MVNNQVDVTTVSLPNTGLETTPFTVSGTLTTFEGININRQESSIAAAGFPLQMDFDFLIATSGAAGPEDVEVNHRTLEVAKDIAPGAPVVITDFFNNIAVGGELHVIPRENREGNVTYDIFYTNLVVGIIDAELTVVTLEVPPGTFPAVAVTTVAPLDATMIFREWRGVNRIYDVFYVDGA